MVLISMSCLNFRERFWETTKYFASCREYILCCCYFVFTFVWRDIINVNVHHCLFMLINMFNSEKKRNRDSEWQGTAGDEKSNVVKFILRRQRRGDIQQGENCDCKYLGFEIFVRSSDTDSSVSFFFSFYCTCGEIAVSARVDYASLLLI